MSVIWSSVSDRIRGLLTIAEGDDVGILAERLGITETDMRACIAGQSRLATLKVVAALVRTHGIDPSWVLTGTFDPTTHRHALEGSPAEVQALVKRLVSSGAFPAHNPRTSL